MVIQNHEVGVVMATDSEVSNAAPLQSSLGPPAVRPQAPPEVSLDSGPSGRSRARARLINALPIVGCLLALVGIWYAVSYLTMSARERSFLLPAPDHVLRTAFFNWDQFQPMLKALEVTSKVAMTGLLISAIIGIGFAIVMAQHRFMESSLFPFAVIVQTIPILAITPLISIWFGYSFTARVVVCVIISLFPLVSNTLFGLKSVDPDLIDLFRLNKANRVQRLLKLQFPAALPATMTGLQQSAGLSVIGAIVGDYLFSQGEPGIGTLLSTYTARLATDNLLAAIILSSLLSVFVFGVFRVLTKLTVGKWYNARRG